MLILPQRIEWKNGKLATCPFFISATSAAARGSLDWKPPSHCCHTVRELSSKVNFADQ